eukprot:scaffold51376_cov62-Phaeocystis_antarctica.AAC.4
MPLAPPVTMVDLPCSRPGLLSPCAAAKPPLASAKPAGPARRRMARSIQLRARSLGTKFAGIAASLSERWSSRS